MSHQNWRADPVIRCLWGKQNELLCADQSESWSDILEARAGYVQVNLDVLARVRISCLQGQVRSVVGKPIHGLETYVVSSGCDAIISGEIRRARDSRRGRTMFKLGWL